MKTRPATKLELRFLSAEPVRLLEECPCCDSEESPRAEWVDDCKIVTCDNCDAAVMLMVGTSLAQSQAEYCDDCWAEALADKAEAARGNDGGQWARDLTFND